METALRETFEEVGLNVKITNQTPIIVSHPIHNNTAIKTIYLFLAKTEDENIKPQIDEVESWQWVSFNKVESYLTNYYKKAWHRTRNIART